MTNTLQFTSRTPDNILTVIHSEGNNVDAIISLELHTDYDTLAHLIGLIKGHAGYKVAFAPLEDTDAVP